MNEVISEMSPKVREIDFSTKIALRTVPLEERMHAMEERISPITMKEEMEKCGPYVERILGELDSVTRHNQQVSDLMQFWNDMMEKHGCYNFGETAKQYGMLNVYIYEYISHLIQRGVMGDKGDLAYHMYTASTPNVEIIFSALDAYRKQHQHI